MFGKKNTNYEIVPFSVVRDGLTIRGLMYKPQGNKLPIAVVSHAFMMNIWTTKKYAAHLAEKGYLAFCFDFNGGSVLPNKSDGKTTDMSVMTELADLMAVINYAKAQPCADPDNLTLMGCSQGGFVSALAAKKLGDQVKNLILFYPALSIPDDARKGQMISAKFDPANVPEVLKCGVMKLGRRYVTDVMELDAFAEISGYQGNVLILHGDKDKIVDISNSEKAHAAYKKARTSKNRIQYTVVKDGSHGFFGAKGKEAVALLDKFLGL